MKSAARVLLAIIAACCALAFMGCAGYTAQQGLQCATATLTALSGSAAAVKECRAAAKDKTDDAIQACVEEALVTLSKTTAAIPACLPAPQPADGSGGK